MDTLTVASIKPGCRFTSAVTIDQNFLVCGAGLPFNSEMIAALQEWNFTEVRCEDSLTSGLDTDDNPERQAKTFQEGIPVTIVESERLKKALEQAAILKDPDAAEEERAAAVETVYGRYLEYIDAVFTRYATHKELQIKDISTTAQSLCDFIAVAKKHILRIHPRTLSQNKNYLVNHSMRATVLAIVTGMKLALPQEKLVELGVSCILHEIGMIRLPPQLYLMNRKLTPPEKKQLAAHPIIGYNILKDCGFSLAIALGVLDHHEKEDGSGYPRRIAGSKISVLAKIISAACSYEAITAERAYKNEETDQAAMTDLIKNTGKQYDETIVRALLSNISFY